MKKLWKKLLAVTTAVMMAITLLPAMANAESTITNPQAKGSLTINKTTDKKDADGNWVKDKVVIPAHKTVKIKSPCPTWYDGSEDDE